MRLLALSTVLLLAACASTPPPPPPPPSGPGAPVLRDWRSIVTATDRDRYTRRDAALKLRAEQSQPRMRAVFNILIQREANTLLPGAVPNIERLAAQLQSATNIILGRRGARLLLGTVMIV